MQCSPAQTLSHSTPRSSPASRARRRGVILPTPPVPSMRLIPTHSPDSRKSTLLPYYHTTSPALETPLIKSRTPPAAPLALSSELRLPPVDPRKARRYCTDFGFAHNRPAQPLPPPPPMYHHDNSSSAGSTPQATYAETDSDASSFYHHIDLEFPQPPASPALRRMQSSPLFTAEETDAVREFLRKRWGTHNVKALQPQLLPGQSPLSDYSWDALSPECGPDALELAGEQLMQAPPVEAHWLQMTPEPSVAPLSPRRSIVPPARVLRRAASMADPPTPLLLLETAPPPLPPRSLRFQDAPLPSLASAGRQKPRHHRANLSVPLMGLGIPDAARPALGSAFAAHPGGHRSARSQPADLAGAPRGGPDPRSFIDLTPEKIVQRGSTANVHRERVKRLLSRASSGFIGWGKALAGKKAHH
ncbi:hypothetical protein B0H14DRAFT_3723109 [Mycena olivaceomarginata]|nr:hypothetical protein B0H14DRAFT_3723109 [Mycena olivaceomarginata]